MTKESYVSGEKRHSAGLAKISDYLLSIVPFWATDFISNLAAMQSPTTKRFDFTLRNVVIQQDHAAGFFPTSRTTPRRISDRASAMAAGLTKPRYSLATFPFVSPA
jgi:hypothetical protein